MQKTNRIGKRFKKLTLGAKITLLYTLLFSIVLILISCFIIGNTWVYYNSVSKSEIIDAADKIEDYIKSGGDLTRDSIRQTVKNNFIEVVVNVKENNKESVLTKPEDFPEDMTVPESPDTNNEHDKRGRDFRFRQISESEYMFVHREVYYEGKTYMVDVFRLFSHEQKIIQLFLIVFIICNAVAIFASYTVGRYISRKMLKPVNDVIDIADSISINDLAQRIDVPETDDEIKKLVVTFNDMISRLDDSFKKQKQFISDVSHELRTPIAVVQGYVNLIDRWGKSDEAILDESIESIKSETERMNVLIQQLLFLARADNNRTAMNIEKICLNEVATDVLKDISVINPDVTTGLEANKDVYISGDANLIKQLMWIFCENSIKYHSERPPKIDIIIGERDGKIFFTVKDNGIGIPEESLSHVFDRFYRADKSRNKSIEGNGLGLSIASWIIKSHNAKVEVQSKVGVGSEFTVVFD